MVQVLDRLAPQDFYNRLDWLRDEWDGDEEEVAKKLVLLRRMYEHLPPRYYERSVPLIEDLCHARLVRNASYLPTLVELRSLASEWDRSRPPLLECEVCGITVRGHNILRQHLAIIHDVNGGL